jgi:hypothetical protein
MFLAILKNGLVDLRDIYSSLIKNSKKYASPATYERACPTQLVDICKKKDWNFVAFEVKILIGLNFQYLLHQWDIRIFFFLVKDGTGL